MQRKFHFEQLIRDVFDIDGSERMLVIIDVPHRAVEDNDVWEERRAMAESWRAQLEAMGLNVAPMVTYDATGAHNRDLPEEAEQLGVARKLRHTLEECDIALVMSEYSATAPMVQFAKELPGLRIASMPMVEPRMEHTALSANYKKMREQAGILKTLVEASQGARVHFESGNEIYFDLRFRNAMVDNGYCPPDHEGVRLINLPSGEVFQAPYEGERDGEPSATIGVIPIMSFDGNDRVQLFVEENRVQEIAGTGPLADQYRQIFEEDPARRNIAEFGLGFNEAAVVKGNVLEDEKAGFHWAFGRSDHIGGVWGPDKFRSPETVMHEDIVYAPGSPIKTEEIYLDLYSGVELMLMERGKYIYPSPAQLDELGLA